MGWSKSCLVLAFRGTANAVNAWTDLKVRISLTAYHACKLSSLCLHSYDDRETSWPAQIQSGVYWEYFPAYCSHLQLEKAAQLNDESSKM